jgi:hypothetical protein
MNDDIRLAQFAENMRFYGDMRFKILTLFLAAMTAVAGGIGQYPQHRWWLALAGVCITAAMRVMEVRSTLNFVALHNQTPELWLRSSSKLFPWLTATSVVLVLHVGFYAFWLGCLRVWCHTCVSFCLGVTVGVILLIFSIVNYWPHRQSLWK